LVTVLSAEPTLAHEIPVHEDLAHRAATQLWPGLYPDGSPGAEGIKTEFLRFLAPTLPKAVPCSSTDATSGCYVTEGAREEDEYDPLYWGSDPRLFCSHFWDPDRPQNSLTGLSSCLDALPSESSMYDAQLYWIGFPGGIYHGATIPPRASLLELYRNPASRAEAYYYLGRIAHLLEDSSVPAHAHDDAHPPNIFSDDPDRCMENFDADYYEWFTRDTYSQWLPPSAPVMAGSLEELFYGLGQRSEYFPSDGCLFCNCCDLSCTEFCPDGEPNSVDETGAQRNEWFDGWPTVGRGGEIDPYQNSCSRSLDDSELYLIANRLMPLAFQYTSGLYKLFWKTMHAAPEALSASLEGNSVRLRWDPPSGGVPVSGYRIYRSSSPLFAQNEIPPSVADVIGEVTGMTEFLNLSPTPGINYYVVTAVERVTYPDGTSAENESFASDVAVARPCDPGHPGAVRITTSYVWPAELLWTGSEFALAQFDFPTDTLTLALIGQDGGIRHSAVVAANISRFQDSSWPNYYLAYAGAEFAVVWIDESSDDVYFRLFSADLTPQFSPVRINSLTDHTTIGPTITWTGTEFGISWYTVWPIDDIRFRRIDPTGTPLGPESVISHGTGGWYSNRSRAAWTGLEHAVIWEEWHPVNGRSTVVFNRVGADGNAIGGDVFIQGPNLQGNSYSQDIIWDGAKYVVGYGSGLDLYIQAIDPYGTFLGPPRYVGTHCENAGISPYLRITWTGSEYFVTWSDVCRDVYIRRLDADLRPLTASTLISEGDGIRPTWDGSRLTYAVQCTQFVCGVDGVFLTQVGECCVDGDGDGYGGLTACGLGFDCDDSDPLIYPGAPERCNFMDDSCDLQIDEGNPEGGQVCGSSVGECRPGLTNCEAGALVCIGAIGPQEETCDGRDNDCDGNPDDGNPGGGGACGSDVGECSYGVSECRTGVIECVGSIGPSVEVCDRLDNDCNGVVDNGQDADGDLVVDCLDSCPDTYNPDQITTAYVTDGALLQLLAVDVISGVRKVVAVTPPEPYGLALDASATMALITGFQDSTLLKVDLGRGDTSVVASGLTNPVGVAFSRTGNTAFVTMLGSGELSRINLNTGQVTSVTSGLHSPGGLAVNTNNDTAYITQVSAGILVAIDLSNAMIRQITSSLRLPIGIALDSSETIAYVAESDGGSLTRIELKTGLVMPIASGLSFPFGVSSDSNGARAFMTDAQGLSQITLASGSIIVVVKGSGFQAVALATGITPIISDPNATVLQWRIVPEAAGYDVVRGNLSELTFDGTSVHLGNLKCIEDDSLDTTTGLGTEVSHADTETPPLGEGFFYLIRPNGGTHAGTYGLADTCSRPRVVDAGDCSL
jgi:DNA-binding beta-propeller fold protein YncE